MRSRRVMLRVIDTCSNCPFCYDGACTHEGRRKSASAIARVVNGSASGVATDERPPVWCPLAREKDVPF